ncbi:hypothetical protein SAMN05216436_107142 [bacterium A37T11]|nr:hypothetical protein SAMN05216436_107142 [bacterium A37T11]
MIALLMAGCSAYKHTSKSSQETFQENTHVFQQVSGQEQNNSLRQLTQQWEQDSLSFQATILASGPYRLSPDSGLSGSDALIRIVGRRKRTINRQDSLNTAQQEKHENKTVLLDQQKSKTSQHQQETRKINVVPWWLSVLVVAILVGGVWYFWIPKS